MKLTPTRLKKVYLPNDPDQAGVEIKYLKKGIRAELERDSNSLVATAKDGVFTPMVEFNLKKKRRMFYEALVSNWWGFTDQHSNDLPCTVDNLELVSQELADFYTWLREESDKFIGEVEVEEGNAQGN